jgi:hypothetical protein
LGQDETEIFLQRGAGQEFGDLPVGHSICRMRSLWRVGSDV